MIFPKEAALPRAARANQTYPVSTSFADLLRGYGANQSSGERPLTEQLSRREKMDFRTPTGSFSAGQPRASLLPWQVPWSSFIGRDGAGCAGLRRQEWRIAGEYRSTQPPLPRDLFQYISLCVFTVASLFNLTVSYCLTVPMGEEFTHRLQGSW